MNSSCASDITAASAKSLQPCPTLCDPKDSSPPGSPSPWDSPGKNTGMGCHFCLQCMKVKSESEVAQSCCYAQCPNPGAGREKASETMQLTKREVYC